MKNACSWEHAFFYYIFTWAFAVHVGLSVPLVSFQPGPALLTVFANGIPSLFSRYLLITQRQLDSIGFDRFKCYRARRAGGAEKFQRQEVSLADNT